MKSEFEKQEFNEEVDHQAEITTMFNEMGYSNISIQTSFTNGLSHYVTLTVEVLNEGKTYAEMFVYNNMATITVRISDHLSGLETNCGGVSRNTMTMHAFLRLIDSGAIKGNN